MVPVFYRPEVTTTAQLFERDRLVFQTCARLGLPVAWNLAGGQAWPRSISAVLELHDNTMRACVEAHGEG